MAIWNAKNDGKQDSDQNQFLSKLELLNYVA